MSGADASGSVDPERGHTGTDGVPRAGVDRRAFVKGAVAGAAVGLVGGGGVAMVGWAIGDRTAQAEQAVTFHGAKVQAGSPTEMGVPLVPLGVDASGHLHGRPYDLRPYLYCGRGDHWVGAREDYGGDDTLRYALPPERDAFVQDEAERRARWWFHDRLGEAIAVGDFDEIPYGEGAMFGWRNEGQEGHGGFYGVLLKLRPEQIQATGGSEAALTEAMARPHDLVAFDAACPHFCCIAGWHEDPSAERLGMWDLIFCSCHIARFDPREIATYSFSLPT